MGSDWLTNICGPITAIVLIKILQNGSSRVFCQIVEYPLKVTLELQIVDFCTKLEGKNHLFVKITLVFRIKLRIKVFQHRQLQSPTDRLVPCLFSRGWQGHRRIESIPLTTLTTATTLIKFKPLCLAPEVKDVLLRCHTVYVRS